MLKEVQKFSFTEYSSVKWLLTFLTLSLYRESFSLKSHLTDICLYYELKAISFGF